MTRHGSYWSGAGSLTPYASHAIENDPNNAYKQATGVYLVGWLFDGNNWRAGQPPPGNIAKFGLVDYIVPAGGPRPANGWTGILCLGNGSPLLSCKTTAAIAAGGEITICLYIKVNGNTVASVCDTTTGGLRFIFFNHTISVTTLIAIGDIVEAWMTIGGSGYTGGNLTIPAGAGDFANHLSVDGTLSA